MPARSSLSLLLSLLSIMLTTSSCTETAPCHGGDQDAESDGGSLADGGTLMDGGAVEDGGPDGGGADGGAVGSVPSSGLLLWLDAEDLDLSDTREVASWADRSGNDHDVLQGTRSLQPRYVASSTGGLPAVQIGGGSYLSTAGALDLAGDHAFSVYIVANVPPQSSFHPVLWSFADLHNVAGGASLEIYDGALGFATGWNENANPEADAYTARFGSPQIVGVVKLPGAISASTSIRYSGQDQRLSGSSSTPDFAPIPFSLGSWLGAQPAEATYSEVLVYDRALSAVEMAQLECHLASKYTIALDPSVRCEASGGPDAGVNADAGTGTDAGGADAGSGTDAGPSSTRYYISYAFTNNIDARSDVMATFDSAGALTSYTWRGDEAPRIGTATASEVATFGQTRVGRWNDGVVQGTFYSLTPWTFAPDEGFHYAITATPWSSGVIGRTATYSVYAATSPTSDAGRGLGSLDRLTMDVVAGSPARASMDLQATLGGETFTYRSAAVDLSTGVHTGFPPSSASSTGSSCPASTCTVYTDVTFAEDNQVIQVAWQIRGVNLSGTALLRAP